jgi:GWxTD domain-containing protein
MDQYRSIIWTVVLLCEFCWPSAAVAQEEPISGSSTEQPVSDRRKTEARIVPCFEAIGRESSKQLEDKAFASLPETDRAWLTEDVAYIIAPEERCAFLNLEYDDQREQFVEQFWLRRSSNPNLLDNDFKEEHYRRVVFANEKFGTEIPGWKTDRGWVYIIFGPPDKIESHASGEPMGRPPEEGPETTQYSWEKWHYRYVEGVEADVDLDFVDPGGLGDYRLTMPLEEKDSLLLPHTHGWVDWKDYEPIRFARSSKSELVVWIGPGPAPQVKFKDLEAMVVSHIIRDQVYFSYRVEYVRTTHASTMARIVIDIPEDELSNADGRAPKAVEMFGRISKLSGWVVNTFERSGSLAEQNQASQPDPNWEVTVPLAPGPYRLAIVVKNLLSGETGVMYTPIDVPTCEELNSHK